MKFILTPAALVVFCNSRPFSVAPDDPRYAKVVAAVQKDDEVALTCALTLSYNRALVGDDEGFEFVGNDVFFDGLPVVGPLSSKLQSFRKEGFPLDNFVAFLRNLRDNPSAAAIRELYDFLAYSELPITEDGTFIAYKGVNTDYWSVTAGDTVLLHGKVDGQGRIFNGIGEVIEMPRNAVDDDRRRECSYGLHVGSHDYARGFGSHTVVVEVNPRDVVSIPLDCSCQKARVCRYKVIADYEAEIKAPVASAKTAKAVASPRSNLADRIVATLASLRKAGGDITLKRIQSALSPECPSVFDIREILIRDLGRTPRLDTSAPTSVGAMIVG